MIYKCAHFGLKELVSPVVYNTWGEQAWMFFSEEILMDLDYIRERYGKGIIINNWACGGDLKQCGLRSNLDPLVTQKTKAGKLYLSAHTMGKGFDLHCSMGKNKKLWEFCHQLILHGETKDICCIEALDLTNGWVHLDDFRRQNIIFR